MQDRDEEDIVRADSGVADEFLSEMTDIIRKKTENVEKRNLRMIIIHKIKDRLGGTAADPMDSGLSHGIPTV